MHVCSHLFSTESTKPVHTLIAWAHDEILTAALQQYQLTVPKTHNLI